MVIAPPSSNATFCPERGGNSASLSDTPAVKALALVKVTPNAEYIDAIGVLSAIPSKSNVIIAAFAGVPTHKSKARASQKLSQRGVTLIFPPKLSNVLWSTMLREDCKTCQEKNR